MSISNFTTNRAKYRKVYAYGMNRRPDVREFIDVLTNVTKSLNFQQIIRDRSYYLINGEMVQTFPTASANIQYSEENYHTTGSVDFINVGFPFTFDEIPFVAFRLYPEWVLASGSNVAYWVTDLDATGFKANFSAPFEGRLTYRAVYTDGAYPVYVERTTGSFVWVAGAEVTASNLSAITMSFDTLPSAPTEVFSNPVGLNTDFTMNIAQDYEAVGTTYTTNILSAPFSGSFNVVAIATVPPGTPQPTDPY